MRNALYYGDCLHVLRKHFQGEPFVDLIYLDPPFNSNRDYNVLFKEQTGAPAEAQVKAFTDTWKWTPEAYAEWDAFVDTCPNQALVSLMQSFIQYLKRNDVTAYLARMTPRLYELHRVLKPTGSLYLHCDPAASHYLKVILDLIFQPENYRNEILWKRTSGRKSMRQFGRIHDTLFFFGKGDSYHFAPPVVPQDASTARGHDLMKIDGEVYRISDLSGGGPGPARNFNGVEMNPPTGRHWMYDQEGIEALLAEDRIFINKKGQPRLKTPLSELDETSVNDVWIDIEPINSAAKERLGYPTQKPVALLKRILEASSKPGDVVLDPFCGCGTTIMAAQELGRRWIGIDVTSTATSLIEARLFDSFHIHNGPRGDYDIIGLPTTEAEAVELANRDKHEFQKWAISLVPRAMPWQEKKGADGGVDGFVRFRMTIWERKAGEPETTNELVIISVKGGQNLKMDDIKNLQATMVQNNAALGFLITLVPPTKGIIDWAGQQGFVKSPEGGTPVPAIQCRTVGQLLRGEAFAFPWNASIHGIPKAGEGQTKLHV